MGLLAKATFNTIGVSPVRGETKGSPPQIPGREPPGLLLRGQKKRDALPSPGKILPPVAEAFQGEIKKLYGAAHMSGAASVQGILLELPAGINPPSAAWEAEKFSVQVNRMVSALGAAAALPSRRCLVLFPNTIDRELLAHRLSKSLKTAALSVFTADNVQAVSDIIRPYL
ncbi:hypothetical protein AGMMS49587_04140 [Spirochaetia bacterium]|nr:hypothetical protein AGMMS49587_04140 [Spirochaetia bacterium]